MKRRREKSKRERVLRLWDWSEVVKAVSYLHLVIGSLREHWLEVLNAERQLKKSSKKEGLMKRDELIAEQARTEERHRAQVRFDDALDELNHVDVFLLDPVSGLALIPFRKGDELAWYVFDHFTEAGVIGWRYHHDPIEECRPMESEVVQAQG